MGPAPCAGIAPSSQDDDEPVPVPTLQDRAGDSRSSKSSSGRRADGSPPRPTTCSGLRDSHRPGNLPVPYGRTGGRSVEAPPRTRPAHRLGQRRGVAESMPNKWTPMLTWTQIESAAVAAGWKRAGVEWRGPCPFCGGRDRAHVRPGSSANFIGSCRRCGADGIALARALVGDVGEAWPAYDDPGPSRADILRRSGFTALSCPAVARPAGRPGANNVRAARAPLVGG